MKRFLAVFLGFLSITSLSFAQDAETDKAFENISMEDLQPFAVQTHALPNPIDLINKVKEQIQTVKDTLLASYDENGNGKIDAGTEFDNMVTGMKALVMVLTDSNQNGKIDGEDLDALAKVALLQAKEHVRTNICPQAIEDAEAAGFWLNFRPVLKALQTFCTTEETN